MASRIRCNRNIFWKCFLRASIPWNVRVVSFIIVSCVALHPLNHLVDVIVRSDHIFHRNKCPSVVISFDSSVIRLGPRRVCASFYFFLIAPCHCRFNLIFCRVNAWHRNNKQFAGNIFAFKEDNSKCIASNSNVHKTQQIFSTNFLSMPHTYEKDKGIWWQYFPFVEKNTNRTLDTMLSIQNGWTNLWYYRVLQKWQEYINEIISVGWNIWRAQKIYHLMRFVWNRQNKFIQSTMLWILFVY